MAGGRHIKCTGGGAIYDTSVICVGWMVGHLSFFLQGFLSPDANRIRDGRWMPLDANLFSDQHYFEVCMPLHCMHVTWLMGRLCQEASGRRIETKSKCVPMCRADFVHYYQHEAPRFQRVLTELI